VEDIVDVPVVWQLETIGYWGDDLLDAEWSISLQV
jgi:hypothetical protein